MMRTSTTYKVFIAIIVVLSAISCNQNDEDLVYNPDLVFANSFKINVDPYVYYNADSTLEFKILGDSAIVPDTISSTPLFKWDKTLSGLVTVVVSKELFVVKDKAIENADQIIWQWHTGMDDGSIGEVGFFEGKTVKNKIIDYDTQPLPLENGLYYWTVYSWESSGREIIYSTKPLLIYVK